jgi:hypothetical protein
MRPWRVAVGLENDGKDDDGARVKRRLAKNPRFGFNGALERREERPEIAGDTTGKKIPQGLLMMPSCQKKNKHKQPRPDQGREDQKTPIDHTMEKQKNQSSPKRLAWQPKKPGGHASLPTNSRLFQKLFSLENS